MNDILGRAIQLAKQMAHQFLRATVWRVVWSLPFVQVLVIAGLIFAVLSIWGL